MSIDEAIKLYESNAEYERTHGRLQRCLNFRQLAEWLRDYKRLKEQEPCEDAVSRKAVLYLVGDYDLSMGQVVKGIHALPSVNPQPKTGHWIFDEILDKHYYCSECKSMGVDYWDYCPYCGARMIEPQAESEGENE